MIPTPKTDSYLIDAGLDPEELFYCDTCYQDAIEFARSLEREAAQQIAELNQRLIERAESIVIQASKIDETWREKLRLANSARAA